MQKPHMQIFLINLDRRPDRLASMRAQLSSHKLSFVRVAAVDGAAYPAAVPEQRISNGQIACHRSHRVCWKQLAESGEPYALILEDDLVLSERFGKFLREPDYFPADADIIRLEPTRFAARLGKRRFATPSGIALHRLFSSEFFTGAYIISAETAKKLLNNDLSNEIPIDILLFTLPAWAENSRRYFVVYQAVPAPSIQMMRCADHRGSSAIAIGDIKHGKGPGVRLRSRSGGKSRRSSMLRSGSRRPPAVVAFVKGILRRPYFLLRGVKDGIVVGFDV
jgi:glycosyl transferase family 25